MNPNTHKLKFGIATVAVVAATALAAGCGGSDSSSTAAAPAGSAAATTTTGGASAVLPVPDNPIDHKSTASGLEISKVLVENNVSPDTGKAVDDHLEIDLKNSSSKPLDQFEAYYTFTDVGNGTTEGYYSKLDGLTIEPGASAVVNFDNTGAPGHYPENEFSLYHTAKNALDVEVTVSSPDVKPATATVQKDAAGAEAGVE